LIRIKVRHVRPCDAMISVEGNAFLPDTRPHQKYEALIARCHGLAPMRTAVVHPCDESALRAAAEASAAKLIAPTLVGPEAKIRRIAAASGIDIAGFPLIATPHSHAAAEQAVAFVRSGGADALMKGSLHTDELMEAVVVKETGLRTARRISHVFIMDVPTYPKPLFITDAAINLFPKLEDKVDIVRNAVELARALGIAKPKVAILSAVETINSKIPSTIDAAALCKMAERGQITGALLDGPLALDNAINREAAAMKGIVSPVAGDADILLVPDLEAGNMLAKELTFLANADAAGIVLGARVPIILTSRADNVRTRLASCAVAALYAHACRIADGGGKLAG
jgi:phosphate acetyltransferase